MADSQRSRSTALSASEKAADAKKKNLAPSPSSPIAERDAKQHNAETGFPKPVDERKVGERAVAESKGKSSSKSKSSASRSGKSARSSSPSKSSKASVTVNLDAVQEQVLDNLRAATSRHDYLQAIVSRHLEAANPVATFQEDDDLPGNEREVRRPNFRV